MPRSSREPGRSCGVPLPHGAPPVVRDLGEPFHGVDVSILRRVIMWGSAALGVGLAGAAALLVRPAPITAGLCGVVALALLLFALNLFTTRRPPVWWACPGGFVWLEGGSSAGRRGRRSASSGRR